MSKTVTPDEESAHQASAPQRNIEDLSAEELVRIASKGSRAAAARTIARGGRISDIRDGKLVWVYPDGHTEAIQASDHVSSQG